MSVMVLVEMSIAEGRIDEVTAWLKTTSADTRAHEGCILLDTYQARRDPNTIVFVEHFQTRAAHDAYLCWRSARGDLTYLADVMTGVPSVRYFDLADV